MKNSAISILAGTALLTIAAPADAFEPSEAGAASAAVSAATRAELVAAREATWRAFFTSDDAGQLERLLGQDLIAIQQSQEGWENRDRLIALARDIRRHGIRVSRLEFPRTEIQLFGDVAILYYTYVFETTDGRRSVTDAGRGTEVFVRRAGRWVDVGWHLDHGAFVRRDGVWARVSRAPDEIE